MKIKPSIEYMIKFITPDKVVKVAQFEGTESVDDLYEYA